MEVLSLVGSPQLIPGVVGMNLLVMAAIILGSAVLGVALMAVVRRFRTTDELFHDSERGSDVFGFVGSAFALLLAFVIVQAYDYFNDARGGVEQEALAVVEIDRTADFFEPADQERLSAAAICYGRAVVNRGWPAMTAGQEGSPVTDIWVHELVAAERSVVIGDNKVTNVAFYQLLEEQDQLTEGRRERIHAATLDLPAPVWLILILGTVLTAGWTVFFLADRREKFWVQACIPAAVFSFISAGLLLIWVLDNPYHGETSILPPTEMAEVLEAIEGERMPIDLPCDRVGNRVE
jgi:hypothetical protein